MITFCSNNNSKHVLCSIEINKSGVRGFEPLMLVSKTNALPTWLYSYNRYYNIRI